jgi:hypothetical protein
VGVPEVTNRLYGIETHRRLAKSTLAILISCSGLLVIASELANASTAGIHHFSGTPELTHSLTTTNLGFSALPSPVRVADSRPGATDPATYSGGTLGPGGTLTVDMPPADVPAGAGAVVAQLTAIDPSASGYLSVFPAGGANPGTANANFGSGQTVGNLITVSLGTDPQDGSPAVTVYNGSSGITDFTLDLYGYYAPQSSSSGDPYVPITPVRIFDTRAGSSEPGQGETLTHGGKVEVPVTGIDGVPLSGVSAIVVNIAVTNTTADSYIQAYATGSPPSSSTPTVNQNWVAGETLSTKAIIGVGSDDTITIANDEGNVDVIVDLDGYFGTPGGSGDLFTPLSEPIRLTDTRPNGVSEGMSVTALVAEANGVPANAVAGVLNVADLATSANFLTVYPAGSSIPLDADVNYVPGDGNDIVDNAAYATTGLGGRVDVYNGASMNEPVNIVVDEFGYFAPPLAPPTTATTTSSTSPTTTTSTTTTSPTTTSTTSPNTPITPPGNGDTSSGLSAAAIEQVDYEANWILESQFADGAIAQAPPPSWVTSVYIDPYTANYAAIGLSRAASITGNVAYAQASWQWLQWYANDEQPGTGFASDATLPFPFVSGDTPTSLGSEDSTDAYAGTFLLAAYDTMEADPDMVQLQSLSNGIAGAIQAIQETQQPDGLTWATPSYQVAYLMDNAEAHAGLLGAASLEMALNDSALATQTYEDASLMESGIQSLWNPVTESFDWAATENTAELTNWSYLYPDAAEQAWAAGLGVATPAQEAELMSEIAINVAAWDDPTATAYFRGTSSQGVAQSAVGYWPEIGWGFDTVGDSSAGSQGAETIEAAAAVTQNAWPFSTGNSGQLIILLTDGPTLAPAQS